MIQLFNHSRNHGKKIDRKSFTRGRERDTSINEKTFNKKEKLNIGDKLEK